MRKQLDSDWMKLQDLELSRAQGKRRMLQDILNLPATIEQSLKTKAENQRSRNARR